jgi:hypothetical protein
MDEGPTLIPNMFFKNDNKPKYETDRSLFSSGFESATSQAHAFPFSGVGYHNVQAKHG